MPHDEAEVRAHMMSSQYFVKKSAFSEAPSYTKRPPSDAAPRRIVKTVYNNTGRHAII